MCASVRPRRTEEEGLGNNGLPLVITRRYLGKVDLVSVYRRIVGIGDQVIQRHHKNDKTIRAVERDLSEGGSKERE